jgi:uncharacterized protein involved in exopolysaccharide biosynthesis
MAEEQNLTLRDVLNIFFRRIRWLYIIVPLVTFSVLIACLIATPSYETAAKVVLTAKRDTSSFLNVSGLAGPSRILNLNVDEIDINTEMEILTSLDLWIKTVEKLSGELFSEKSRGALGSLTGETRNYWSLLFGSSDQNFRKLEDTRQEMILRTAKTLLSAFKVTPLAKSKVLDLSFKYDDSVMATKILSTLLDLYIPYHMQVYSVPGAESFFTEQVAASKEIYEKADRELTEFRKKWNISLPDLQKTELINFIKRFDEALADVEVNHNQFKTMLALMSQGVVPSGQLAPGMQRGNENTVINVAAVQLLQAEQRRLQSAEMFTLESRDYRAAAEQLDEVINRFKGLLLSEISLLEVKRASLEKSREEKINEMQVLIGKAEEARALQLEVTMAKEQYIQFVAKSEAARLENIEAKQELVDVKVLAKPMVPLVPVFPRTGLFVFAGFLFSIFLSVGLIFVAHFFDFTFDNPRDLEASVGYPVLATFGNVDKR